MTTSPSPNNTGIFLCRASDSHGVCSLNALALSVSKTGSKPLTLDLFKLLIIIQDKSCKSLVIYIYVVEMLALVWEALTGNPRRVSPVNRLTILPNFSVIYCSYFTPLLKWETKIRSEMHLAARNGLGSTQ